MAAPPPCPPPKWVLLRRFPRADDLAEDDRISLALDAPPRITQLAGSPSLLSRGSGVLAADCSGVLLLSDSFACVADPLAADKPASTSYLLWDAVYKNSRRIPAPDAQTGTAGLVVVPRGFGNYDIMVAELVLPSADSVCVLCRFFMPSESNEWIEKTVHFPEFTRIKFPWSGGSIISHKGKLFWVDLLQGFLTCDPFADKTELQFLPLPAPYMLARGNEKSCREGLIKDRCINVSCGKIRLVVITRRTLRPVIKLWTFHDPHAGTPAGTWSMDYQLPFFRLWEDQSYTDTGLPAERPVVVVVHPSNPHVVYFSLNQYLFSVDLERALVIDITSTGRDESSNSLLAWELPSDSSSKEDHAFESVLNSFCREYSRQLADMDASLFGELALGFLNKKIENEGDKFKLSEHISLCCFYEGEGTKRKKYAHMNFYAHTSAEKVLVFAELHIEATAYDDHDEVDYDDWTVSLCTIIPRNGDKGRMKRKSSLKCYGCEADVLHPISGFLGGYCREG